MKQSLKRKLQLRFVLFSLLGLLVMQGLIVGLSIYHNHRDLASKSDMLVSQLHHAPSGAGRYFSVKLPAGKDAVYPDTVQNVSVSPEEAAALARRALQSNRTAGFLDGYRYRIYQNESGKKIYFLLRESGIEMCRLAAENMIAVSLLGIAAIGGLLIPVSGWVVKPLLDNREKQKQFITAAGHQLKTPLTVISTNAQLLELELGENPWLTGIQKQVQQLTQLTHRLVTLSKAEEYETALQKESFSLTEAVQEVSEVYQVIARQKGIRLTLVPCRPLRYTGSKDEVQQLLQLLLDNACKYCPPEGSIQITTAAAFRGVLLTVVNTATPLPEGSEKALLQRFCRGENAADIPGFGLGLSIAEAIAIRNNGHITVSISPEGQFRVEVMLR